MQKRMLLFLFFSAFIMGKAQTPPGLLLHLANGQIRLNAFGFPEQVQAADPSDSLLAENIHFHFIRQSDGKDIRLKSEGIQFTKTTPEKQEWKATASSDTLKMVVTGYSANSGLLIYSVQVEVLAS